MHIIKISQKKAATPEQFKKPITVCSMFYVFLYFAATSSSKTRESDNESGEIGGNEEIDQVCSVMYD